GADVASFEHSPAAPARPLALTAHHFGTNGRVRGDDADGPGDLRTTDLDRRVDAVDPGAIRGDLEVEVPDDLGDPGGLGGVDPPAQRGEGHAAIHRPRVEVLEPEPLGEQPRHGGLARPGGAVDGDHSHRWRTLAAVVASGQAQPLEMVEVFGEGLRDTAG